MAAPDSIESTKNPFAQNTSTKKRHVSHKKSLLKKEDFLIPRLDQPSQFGETFSKAQCPRANLNKMFLPKPKTTTT